MRLRAWALVAFAVFDERIPGVRCGTGLVLHFVLAALVGGYARISVNCSRLLRYASHRDRNLFTLLVECFLAAIP